MGQEHHPSEMAAVSVVSPAHCVGPDYRPAEQKPTATVSTEISYDNVHILPQTPQLIALLTYVSITPDFYSGDGILRLAATVLNRRHLE